MIKNGTIQGILAGLCISLGGIVYLSCEDKVVGALLFCVALMSICYFGFSLFTGKIGFLAVEPSRKNLIVTLTGLLGNLIGCLAFGLLSRVGLAKIAGASEALVAAKLGQTIPEALIRGFFCGVLMYIAVWIFREKKTPLGIFVCIPTFILGGMEHSIADMFYFFAAASFTGKSFLYLFWIVLGNTVGGMAIPLLQKLLGKSPENG